MRESFFYGREFLNDADLNERALAWLRQTANARVHGTTGEVPQVRFDRDERAVLTTLAPRPYRSVIALQPPPRLRAPLPSLPTVERRSLALYSRIARERA